MWHDGNQDNTRLDQRSRHAVSGGSRGRSSQISKMAGQQMMPGAGQETENRAEHLCSGSNLGQ